MRENREKNNFLTGAASKAARKLWRRKRNHTGISGVSRVVHWGTEYHVFLFKNFPICRMQLSLYKRASIVISDNSASILRINSFWISNKSAFPSNCHSEIRHNFYIAWKINAWRLLKFMRLQMLLSAMHLALPSAQGILFGCTILASTRMRRLCWIESRWVYWIEKQPDSDLSHNMYYV